MTTWGVFGVVWGQNLKVFRPRQIMYQNEALGPVITKTGSRGRPSPHDPKFGVIWGHLGSKFKNFQSQTNYAPI